MRFWIVTLLGTLVAACGDGVSHPIALATPQNRQTVIWIDEGVDDELAASLRRAGVSRVVVRQGTVNLTSAAPVLRIVDGPEIAGEIPVAPALRIETGDRALDADTGETLWRGLGPVLAGAPAELVLDMPRLPEGADIFVAQLSEASGLDVVPILSVDQVSSPRGLAVALAAGQCIVPLFGPGGGGLRGAGQEVNESLVIRLQPLLEGGVRLRAGVILRPQTTPPLRGWGEGVGPLLEGGNAEVRRASSLGREFVFVKEMEWSGRGWQTGESVDVGWMDAARLHTSLAELDRLVLLDIVGWDLVSMPPRGDALGMNREALFAYLEGRGPGPELAVVAERRGRSMRVRVTNTGPFSSAVSNSGHWLEVAVPGGVLAVRDSGDFDTLALGSRRRGEWKPGVGSGSDAVRFGEIFIGPGEEMITGSIQLPSSRSEVTIRWRVVLSNGEAVQGVSRS